MPDDKPAEVTDIGTYYEQSPEEFLTCRLFGHAFRPGHKGYLVEGDPKRPTALLKKLTCLGCGSTAIDTYHTYTLERIGSRSIHYAEGYLAKGTRLSRQDVRVVEAAAFGYGERYNRRTGGRRKRAT